ncbi:MAG: THUMP domain-containing protein [Betaproteobacteria bacterium]|nr:THUMP domain-containing protein [Betaproteobacteria bacterium]MDH3435795.1 THUMP domain-containing protein [Betaproteobacteria bacterium]
MEQFFATCPRGLEQALAAELSALGAHETAPVDGGASFAGDLAICYRVNLESRVASRVLWQVGHARYQTDHDIHEAARALAWPRLFDVRRSIRVNVSAIRSPVKSIDFVTLSVKDAVCDVFRAARGKRPDVNTARPDVRIHVFLTRDTATFYLDTSGEALFKRGWRAHGGDAPLRENLAAGIIRLTGWAPPVPFFDPMCGSGTFLMEAAMMALDAAPGANRAFGFEQLENFESRQWRAIREKALARRKPARSLPIYGSDKSGNTLELARTNITAAGLANAVQLKQMDVLDGGPPAASGILVTNPPYGERLANPDEVAVLYPKLGDALKQRFSGWTAYLLSADPRLPKLIRLQASKRTPLYNGALECRLYEYRLVAGTMRRPKKLTANEVMK